ncbi:hypothetical protein TorRG33x02_031850 [Trema orientale]|uniref:Uncharacterized protein n=1 Tax=Trema orientale TaxID=63057 RepID=A0A2P5FT92_TREOI|nr:hypothetical protein TorRG33x02_031850 [Trema orientale]
MEAENRSYALDFYVFKAENPSPAESSLATLEIRVMSRYIIRLQLNQQQQHQLLGQHFCDDDAPLDIEHVVSPVFTRRLAFPPHVLALPRLRESCVAEALRSLFGGAVCEGMLLEIERFVGDAAEALGYMDFGVVAHVFLTSNGPCFSYEQC